MTPRENLLSLYRKTGYEYAPVDLILCPLQIKEFEKRTGQSGESYREYFDFPQIYVKDLEVEHVDEQIYRDYHDNPSDKMNIDHWGIGHEPGSEASAHMTYMKNPMKNFTSIEEFEKYPYPAYLTAKTAHIAEDVKRIHDKGYAASASMACTIWEIAWYMRGMEQLMTDMLFNRELAEYHFNRITEIACHRARVFAKAGVDIILTGDDVGMQESIMMSEDMYCEWIKPRFAKVIAAAKEINPDVIIVYHSCGYVEPLIPHFIECGIDVLNPVQPECMDFENLFKLYGDKISFNGTVGIQTTMPFGTPDEVRAVVRKNLDIAGPAGGLFCCPAHMIEPEVPWENIMAYVEACQNYKP